MRSRNYLLVLVNHMGNSMISSIISFLLKKKMHTTLYCMGIENLLFNIIECSILLDFDLTEHLVVTLKFGLWA